MVPRGINDEPDWSPDGSQIVFFRLAHGDPRSDIYVVNVDGSGRTRLTDTPKRWEWSPTFSPNGQRIAFGRGQGPRAVDQADLFSMAVDGTDEQRLTDTGRLDEIWFTWQST